MEIWKLSIIFIVNFYFNVGDNLQDFDMHEIQYIIVTQSYVF